MQPRGYRKRSKCGHFADLAVSVTMCPSLAYFRDFTSQLYDFLRLSPQPQGLSIRHPRPRLNREGGIFSNTTKWLAGEKFPERDWIFYIPWRWIIRQKIRGIFAFY